MPWFKVDDSLHSSKKLLAIPRRNRLAAIGLWTIAGSWSADQLEDGIIPNYMLEEWGGTPTVIESLVKAGLWERDQDNLLFRNWAEYQPTKQDVEREREAARERMRNARAKRKGVKMDEQRDAEDCSPEQKPKFPRSSPEVREAFDNPDPVPFPVPVPVPTQVYGSDDPAPLEESSVEIEVPGASHLIAEWIDHLDGPRPPRQVIGQLSKEIKKLLDEGQDFADVRNAVIAWSTKALHPSTLASVLHETRNPRTMTRGSEERLSAGLSLAQRAGRLNNQTDPFEKKAITT